MPLNPSISYSHVLAELSVNRKDPCEIIRELISNSYDAESSLINIYPILQYDGFIFFDNGIGLSQDREINGIAPYRAFFSIGKSTKIYGNSIGYKCQGSKLCFASTKFSLITRCEDEENWRSIEVDNPKDNLNQDYDLSSTPQEKPWQFLRKMFNLPDNRTVAILDHLNEEFFTSNFKTGTMIIVQGFMVDNFAYYFGTDGPGGKEEWSYIKNYIRFNTRHGDIRNLRPEKTGFPQKSFTSLKRIPSYNEKCNLHLWTKGTLKEIEAGYPYLPQPDEQDLKQIKSPINVSRLRNGNFFDRRAITFEFAERYYSLILAIDGNRRALDNYLELDRQGSNGKRSGVRLTDQRGAFICAEGVKICQFNEIFEDPKLKDYSELATSNGQAHYVLMINGSFPLVTNRNSLSDDALKILRNDFFVDKVKQFLDASVKESSVFRELLQRLRKESEVYRIESYLNQFNELKNSVPYRKRFKVTNVEQLKDRWLLEPSFGEEHWLGSLYCLFSHLVPVDSPFSHLWLRPRTFSGVGIDSIGVQLSENRMSPDMHKGIEYKYIFSTVELFNHPLIVTDQVVCWEISSPASKGDQVKDAYDFFGYVSLTDELSGIGYEIENIQSLTGDGHPGKVKVISLKELIDKTFSCEWINPPSPDSGKGKSSKKK